ncbi:stromal antigen [Corchorus olitorius]|uniref:Stromal antigen n=1 Tax=Corchorus olitorius TaxID=93759 RepID=A0A1R3H3W3_9ROSI|nr:stromal antigen [Corchorus olitorius]
MTKSKRLRAMDGDNAPSPSLLPTRRSKRIRDRSEATTGNNGSPTMTEPMVPKPKRTPPSDQTNQSSGSPIMAEPMVFKAKRTPPSDQTNQSLSLIEVIEGDGKHITETVRRWVDWYEKEPKPAMSQLLSMLIQACGAKCEIKEEFFDEANVEDVVVALVDLARNGEVEEHHSFKSKEFKKFKGNLVSFWDNLVIECQYGPLFDNVLFDKCLDYVIALSSTPARQYRQVAVPIGLQLVTSFITVAKTLSKQGQTSQRQSNAKKAKKEKGPVVEQLVDKTSRTQERVNMTKQMMEKLYTRLFRHRYRDIDPNIRMMCIESLGTWICSHPVYFLQDEYLKYFGWMLNDKIAGVRKASVLALQNLYDQVANSAQLTKTFCKKFSNRIIELVDDIDVNVAVSSIGLIRQLLRHELLDGDNLQPLYDDLVIDDKPEIRHAIGELLYDHLIAENMNSLIQSGAKGNDSQDHLDKMLEILRKFSTNSTISLYFIDAVWDYMKAMKDWKCIFLILLDQDLAEEDATNLVRLLSALLRKAVGEKVIPIDDRKQCHKNKAQKETFEKNRQNITIAMMMKGYDYPSLLSKFLADKKKVPLLLEIIIHMNLELYSLKKQEEVGFQKGCVQCINEAFFKHFEEEALRSCVKAIEFCCSKSPGELRDFFCNKLKDLEDELITKLKCGFKEVMDDGDEYNLLVNLKRLYELQLSRPLQNESLYEDIITFLHSYRDLNDEVTSFLLLNVYLHIAWSLKAIINSKTVSQSSVSSLLSKRDTLFEELEYFLNNYPKVGEDNKSANVLACRVCTILADLWCIFRKREFSSTMLENLGFSPSTLILQKFWGLCEQLFSISEDQDVDREYIEETSREVVMIAAAKLIVTDIVPKEFLAPKVISHFVMHGTSMTEIVKNLIKVLKKNDNDVSSIFLEALKRTHQCFMELSTSDDESLRCKSFQDCKDLAAELSGTFEGANQEKDRSDILKIVKGGITYAFEDAPKQLSFLEAAVSCFIPELPISDVQDIQKDLEKRMENHQTVEDPSRWQHYHAFYNALKAIKK